MYPKNYILNLFFIFLFLYINVDASKLPLRADPNIGQAINVNPDPEGEPWYAGGIPDRFTEAQIKRIESLPVLDLSSRNIRIPYKVDNSEQKFFRPIFRQQGGSCAQASGIGYHFTYEVNFEQNTEADIIQNQFPSHYTWNYLNDGVGNGSIAEDGWDIVQANGCPNLPTFGGMTGNDMTNTKWMNEYSKYLNGMNRRVVSILRTPINTPEGIKSLKQWFFDHGESLAVGGIANFSTNVLDSLGNLIPIDTLPAGTEESGKLLVTKWGIQGGHAMILAGYNDSIRFDINKDGKFTNNIDINGDGVVDVKDWEIGAYKVANSWGTNFGNDGFVYMLYRVGALTPAEGGLMAAHNARFIRVKNDYEIKLVYKVKLKHNIRNKIKISAGIANDTDATEPDYECHFPIYTYQGGEHPLEGKFMSDEVEIAFDIYPLLKYLSSKKVKLFLKVNSAAGSGKISSFSLLEFRDPITIVEKKCDVENMEIKKGSNVMSLIYEPHIQDLVIETKNLPKAKVNETYSAKLEASGGKKPYKWSVLGNVYTEVVDSVDSFPLISDSLLVPDNKDDGIAEKKLAFDFPFYGEKYTSIYISTDGSILFSPGFQYIRSRSAIINNKVITPLGGDLTFELDGDDMYYKGYKDSVVIRWKTTKFWGKDDKVNVDIAVKLFPSGKIKFYYNKDLTNNLFGLGFGISNGNREDYHILKFESTSEIPDNHVVELEPSKLPDGIEFKEDGTISGTPTEASKSWDLVIRCQDADGQEKRLGLIFATDKASTELISVVNQKFQTFQYYVAKSKVIFSFNAKQKGSVSLDILNLSGRKIHTFKKDVKDSERQTFVWDLKASTAPGLYLCKIKMDKQTLVKRVMLLK